MTETGWKHPQNVKQDARSEINNWRKCYSFVDLDNIKKNDYSYSDIRPWPWTGVDTEHKSPFLYAYNYGFNLPSNATVKKITVFFLIQQITHPKPKYDPWGKYRYSISKFHSVKLKTGASTIGEGSGNNFAKKSGSQNLPYKKWSTESQTTFSGTPKEWGLTGDNIITTINSGNFGVVLQVIGTIWHGWVNPAVAQIKMNIEYEVPALNEETPKKSEFTKLTVDVGGNTVTFTKNISPILGSLTYSDYSKPIIVNFNFYHKGMAGETPTLTFESKGLTMGANSKSYAEGKYSTSKYTMPTIHCGSDDNEKKYTQTLAVFPGMLLGIQNITYTYNKTTYTLRFNVDDETLTSADKAKFMNANQQCMVKNSLFYNNHAVGIGGAMCITSEFYNETGNIYGIMITEDLLNHSNNGNVNLILSNFIQKDLLSTTTTTNVAPSVKNNILDIGQKGTVYYKNPFVVSANTNITYEVTLGLNEVGSSDGRFGILNLKNDGTLRTYKGLTLSSSTHGTHATFRVEVTGQHYKLSSLASNTTVNEGDLSLYNDNNNWYVYFLSSKSGKISIEKFNTTPLLMGDVWGDKDDNTTQIRKLTTDGKINMGIFHNTGVSFPTGTTEWKLKITFEMLAKGTGTQLNTSVSAVKGYSPFSMYIKDNYDTVVNGKIHDSFFSATKTTNTLNIERNDNDLYVWYRATNQNLVYLEFKPTAWGTYLFMEAGAGSSINITGIQKMKSVTDNSNVADNKFKENDGVACHNVAWLEANKIVGWTDFTSASAGEGSVNHTINNKNEFVVGHNNYVYFTIPDVSEFVIGVTFRRNFITETASWYTMGVIQDKGNNSTYYRISEAITANEDISRIEYLDQINEKQNEEAQKKVADGITAPNITNTIFFIKKGKRFAIQFNNAKGTLTEYTQDYAYVKNTKFYIRAYNTDLILEQFTFNSY